MQCVLTSGQGICFAVSRPRAATSQELCPIGTVVRGSCPRHTIQINGLIFQQCLLLRSWSNILHLCVFLRLNLSSLSSQIQVIALLKRGFSTLFSITFHNKYCSKLCLVQQECVLKLIRNTGQYHCCVNWW